MSDSRFSPWTKLGLSVVVVLLGPPVGIILGTLLWLGVVLAWTLAVAPPGVDLREGFAGLGGLGGSLVAFWLIIDLWSGSPRYGFWVGRR